MKPELLTHLPLRVHRGLGWCAAAFVLYSFFGFFVLPSILKWQMARQLPAITKRQTTVQQVKVNPWTLSLTVRGLALTESDGSPFASWDELYVNFQTSSLFRWAWTFKEIRIVKPFGEVILLKGGRLNVANMLDAEASTPARPSRPVSIPRVNIFRLEITNGFVALEDRTRRSVFRTEYRPINFHLTGFSTHLDSDTPYSFRAESDAGRSVAWAGDLSIQPLRSSGHLEVTGVKLSRYQPYLEEFTSTLITNGLADVQFSYRLAAGTNGFDLAVTNGAIQVAQLQVFDPTSAEIVTQLRGLDVQRAEFDLRSLALRLGSVKVTEAALISRVRQSSNGSLVDLLLTLPPLPLLSVSVDDFSIEQAAVSFEDLTRRAPFKMELKPIEVSLKHFSTRTNSDARYSFRMVSEMAEVFAGAGTVSINPIRSTGEVTIRSVDVKKYLPYAEDFFRGKILSGKVEARIPYRFALGTNRLLAGVSDLGVKLTDLAVNLPESAETVTHIAEIGFERVDASLEDRRGRVGLFKGEGGSVLVRRQKDGAINLLGLLAVSGTNVAAPLQSSLDPPGAPVGRMTNVSTYALGGWALNVDEIQLDNYTFKVEDLMPSKPATFLLDKLALNLKGVSSAPHTPTRASIAFRLNESGTFAAQGTAMIEPLFADLDIAVTNLDLRAAQPYVEQFASVGIVNGALNTAGKIRFQTNDSATPLLTFTGGVHVTNFVTADQVLFKEFVRWEALSVSGVEAALGPNRLKIDEVRLVRPRASLIIGADRRPNLSLIMKPESTATNRAAVSALGGGSTTNPLANSFSVKLGTLVVDRASVAFADESVQPRIMFDIEEISGTVQGLSSDLGSPADLDLHGRVDVQSPFAVTGRVNPFAAVMFVDLVITNANTQLTSLTGYMEKYGGFPLKKGRVSSSLHYRIEGKALQAENKILVDQFTLGPRNNSADATSLPLKLGIALLKDNEGRIELDVPLSGRLDDPKFSVGPIILKVIVNTIVKAATSPFKLLGSLVGGGGDELGFIQFKPGTTNLVDGELGKLGKLTTALAKRPALNLEIEAAVDPILDRTALAQQKLGEQLTARRLQELNVNGGRPPVSLESFQIEPEERVRLLRIAFVEQFGTNIAAILETNQPTLGTTDHQAPAASRRASEPKQTLFGRMAGIFSRAGQTISAEKRLTKADREALGSATPELIEELLTRNIPVTSEEFRQLMTTRERWVRDWFLQNGPIDPNRLFLVGSKPVDAAYRGESRVNLSLN